MQKRIKEVHINDSKQVYAVDLVNGEYVVHDKRGWIFFFSAEHKWLRTLSPPGARTELVAWEAELVLKAALEAQEPFHPNVPFVTITSASMGWPNVTAADHVSWFAYFAANIEEKTDFGVDAAIAPFGNGEEDTITGGDEDRTAAIWRARDLLWKEWSAGVRIEHQIQKPKGDA